MKQLTCEMCGSTDLLKQDGVFVCQTCGTKYSVEEAKKLMIEGVVEVTGTVKVDSTASIENYLVMANTAFEAANYPEVEAYCNKIIEIDSANYEAWLLKGKAAGWQSTLKNPRITESVFAFSRAVSTVPEEFKDNIVDVVTSELTRLVKALISARGELFAKYPSEEGGEEFINDIKSISSYLLQFARQTKVFIHTDEIFEFISDEILQSAKKAYIVFLEKYSQNAINGVERFGDNCYVLISLLIIELSVEDKKCDIQRYEEALRISGEVAKYAVEIELAHHMHNSTFLKLNYKHLSNEERKRIEKKINDFKIKELVSEYNDKPVSELLSMTYSYFYGEKKDDVTKVGAIFDVIIAKLPDECIGYLGKAYCYIHINEYNNMYDMVCVAKDKVLSPEYEDLVKKICNAGVTDSIFRKWTTIYVTQDIIKDFNMLIEICSDEEGLKEAFYEVQYLFLHEKGDYYKKKEVVKILLDNGMKIDSIYDSLPDEIINMVKEKNPDVEFEEHRSSTSSGSSGCYVATCVYGSYDCPQVWTLRRYRDDTLGSTWYGRLFIHTYYAISPTLVKWFGHTNWFKKMWKGKLDRMVAKLQSKGVENTPYEDKKW